MECVVETVNSRIVCVTVQCSFNFSVQCSFNFSFNPKYCVSFTSLLLQRHSSIDAVNRFLDQL